MQQYSIARTRSAAGPAALLLAHARRTPLPRNPASAVLGANHVNLRAFTRTSQRFTRKPCPASTTKPAARALPGAAAQEGQPLTTVAAAPDDPPATAQPPPPPVPRKRLVLFREVLDDHLMDSRILIPADLGMALAGPTGGAPGEVVTVSVPIHLPTSVPHYGLPSSCVVAVSYWSKGAPSYGVLGLGPFLRRNGAVELSSRLLLEVQPPDRANGYDTPSLTVRLMDQQTAKGLFLFGAMYSYVPDPGPWTGDRADSDRHSREAAGRTKASGAPGRAAEGEGECKAALAPLRAPMRRSPSVTRGSLVGGGEQLNELLMQLPEGLDQVHVEAVQDFLTAPSKGKVVRTLPLRALALGLFNVPRSFATAFNPHTEQGVKPAAVQVPVVQCRPQEAPAPLQVVTIRGSPRLRTNGRIEWESSGYRAWLKAVRAVRGDVLLVWAAGIDEAAWQAFKAPGDACVGKVGLRVHLIRREEVGQEALEAIVALLSG